MRKRKIYASQKLLAMHQRFRDKHVLITGGASGIGLALAKGCLARGAKVSILDIAADASETASSAQEGIHGVDVRVYRADVGAYDQARHKY